jgi:hypothetical protein
MKNLVYPIITCSILAISQAFTAKYFAGNSLDVNLNGGANLNINNANNNKLTTPLKNYTPVPVPQGQVDLRPLATPPVTYAVSNYFGGYKNIDQVDSGYSNAAEAMAIHKREGLYVGNAPQGIPDDQPVQADDVTNFLNSYHSYLKDVGVESGYSPGNYVNNSQPIIIQENKAKKSSELPPANNSSMELLANQQKLLVDTSSSDGTPKNH